MDWHTLTDTTKQDPLKLENTSMAKINLIDEIVPRYRSPYFSHMFAGGYSSGYYSYIWAEVLDADSARAYYESIVRQNIDPALLEYMGQGMFRARIFPFSAPGE